ncbi:MAG: heparinase II/III-family protein [Prevotella sp.]|jgi:hypothetical protein|nr:heparinase II/III-family protein [Prevotella sp.]MCI2080809.1 heparinase II/III-family protein [Prevotella sp.]MCI2102714.1 heparinase II/III-family protein [Prevotella sp.]
MKHLLILWFFLCANNLLANTLLSDQYTYSFMEDNLVSPEKFYPVPQAGNAFWQRANLLQYRSSYIHDGELYLGKPWISLPAWEFARYKRDGNRSGYEAIYFRKRKQFAKLVLAEILEGKGRFLPDIVNGLQSTLEETWWGLPAHQANPYPVDDNQVVDLFNAETSSMIAWTKYMLEPQLDSISPLLCQRIDKEIKRRILIPALHENYWWKTAGMNWNPWICSNWLTCVLFCEGNRQEQVDAVCQIIDCMDHFIKAYPADGGCDEGAGYWDRASASLFECLNLLFKATNHKVDVRGNAKIEAMMSYIYKMYIGNGWFVDFADTHANRNLAQLNIVYPLSLAIPRPAMQAFVSSLFTDLQWKDHPSQCYENSGNWPTLGRELIFLSCIQKYGIPSYQKPKKQEDVWLNDLQIMALHRGRLFLAAKGGTNGESHNHNDVGSFIVYADNEPLLIDPAVGDYTSQTFSKRRYEIWTMQSAYHNLPTINGTMEKNGKEFGARNVMFKDGILTMDISQAYPKDAHVKKWVRTIRMGKKVTITESYQLDRYAKPSTLTFMTPYKPDLSKQGTIRINGHALRYNQEQMEATVEDISGMLDATLSKMWGAHLYRILLTIKGKQLHNQLQYTVN